MDEQIRQIEYENEEGDSFYFDEHSSPVGFYNANKNTLDDLNEYLSEHYSEGFITYYGGDMISVNYTTIFSDEHFRGIIDDDADMDLLGQFIALLEGAVSNIVNQQQQGGKKRKRSRKERKTRKTRKSCKRLKGRKSRKTII